MTKNTERGNVGPRTFLHLLALILLAGCAAIEEKIVSKGSSSPPGTTYSCFDYNKYDDQTTCNNLTLAQCEASWQSFPGGGLQPCYSPVAGGEACLTLTPTPQWIYSEPYDPNPTTNPLGTYCRGATTVSGTQFYRLRSLVGCSSSICLCQGTVALYQTTTVIAPGAPIPGIMDSSTPCCPGLSATTSPACI